MEQVQNQQVEELKFLESSCIVKSARKELRKALHPHSVETIEFENQPIDSNVISLIQGYLVIYLMIFVVSLQVLFQL